MIKPDEEINQFDDVTPFVYLYVRADLPPVQQVIQTAHAAHEAGIHYGKVRQDENGVPLISHFCVFQLKDGRDLAEVGGELAMKGIRHHTFFEPDFDMGLSAIATEPLIGVDRKQVPVRPLLRMNKRHIW